MAKILVTGGCGYIGSHTVVDLLENGYEVIVADDLSRGSEQRLEGIKSITGRSVKFYCIDLCDPHAVEQLFSENTDIEGIIHFAAYMRVPESVKHPLMYFRNNLGTLINIIDAARRFKTPHFIFSSSCSVYGNPGHLPVTEQTPLGKAESPYARTKQIGEWIMGDTVKVNPLMKAVTLRYFNSIGAHPSARLGEFAVFKPYCIIPSITQTAAGIRDKFTIAGSDYNTLDGTCVRDYIHVCDIAHAHTLALRYLEKNTVLQNPEVFNLGTGLGATVLQVIQAFENATGVKLNNELGPRRAGDVGAIYANKEKAEKILGWEKRYDLNDMMATAWEWEKSQLKKDKPVYNEIIR